MGPNMAMHKEHNGCTLAYTEERKRQKKELWELVSGGLVLESPR